MCGGFILQSRPTSPCDIPFLGGSIITHPKPSSGAVRASAQMNSAFETPFSSAFSAAFFTASGIISTPVTEIPGCAFAKDIPIVPAPQYRSAILSGEPDEARLIASRYSNSAAPRLT